jgi:HD-GYP domain-containing protein (c-di-GMP phosphodiesterase class II)
MPRSVKGDILYPFATLSLIVLVFVGVALAMVVGRDIEGRMRGNTTDTTAAVVSAALAPHLQGYDLQSPLIGPAYDQLQQFVAQSLLSSDTLRLRIYNNDGVVVYSSDGAEVGRSLADETALAGAFGEETTGRTAGSELRPQGAADGAGEVLQVYTPLYSSDVHRVAAALEIDQDYAATAADIAQAQRFLYFSLGAAMAGLYVVLQLGAWGATHALAKDHARLAYLHQTGEHVRSSLDTQEVLTQIVRDATVLAQGEYGLVCLLEEESGGLAARAAYDHEKNAVSLHYVNMDEWLFHRVVATGEATVSTLKNVRYGRMLGPDIENVSLSVVCVPMTLRHKVNGIIVVLKRSLGDAFGRAEIKLLEEVAGQAAMAVEQANLFAKVRAYASELELSYDTTLKALIAALDAKDAATEGHSERVAKLTVAIAREMDVPGEKLVDIERGALLHDVGKIGVPDAVLRKPRTLSRREWQTMQRHPLLAGVLVSKVGFLEGALPILLYHHERYDGRGYPFGLAGDRIPVEARIFAVVDAYDAMTSDRPYRKAMSHEDAIAEIVANAETQFDPAVVRVFQEVVETLPLGEEATRREEEAGGESEEAAA